MLDKVFVFRDLNHGTYLFLNACYSSTPDEVLEFYINWYNSADGMFYEDTYSPITMKDFEYINSVCPIDFYTETKNAWYKKQNPKRGHYDD